MDRNEVLAEIQVLNNLLSTAKHYDLTNLADVVVIRLTELLNSYNK